MTPNSRIPGKSGFRSWITKGRVIIGGVLGVVLIVIGTSKDWLQNYADAVDLVNSATRPAYSYFYGIGWLRERQADSLVNGLHPGAAFCVLKATMADLVDDGWPADLLVEYAEPAKDASNCEDDHGNIQLAVFTPVGFFYLPAGSNNGARDPDVGLPFSWRVDGRFIFQDFYQVDEPPIGIWYVEGRKLVNSHELLKITDDSEHDYTMHTKRFEGGLVIWGLPEGMFYIHVDKDGKFTKAPGLPKSLDWLDGNALVLNWDGATFRGASGEEVVGYQADLGKIKVDPLSHLYISRCETNDGFVESASAPGAFVPLFDKSPVLTCGGSNEEDHYDITVEKSPVLVDQ